MLKKIKNNFTNNKLNLLLIFLLIILILILFNPFSYIKNPIEKFSNFTPDNVIVNKEEMERLAKEREAKRLKELEENRKKNAAEQERLRRLREQQKIDNQQRKEAQERNKSKSYQGPSYNEFSKVLNSIGTSRQSQTQSQSNPKNLESSVFQETEIIPEPTLFTTNDSNENIQNLYRLNNDEIYNRNRSNNKWYRGYNYGYKKGENQGYIKSKREYDLKMEGKELVDKVSNDEQKQKEEEEKVKDEEQAKAAQNAANELQQMSPEQLTENPAQAGKFGISLFGAIANSVISMKDSLKSIKKSSNNLATSINDYVGDQINSKRKGNLTSNLVQLNDKYRCLNPNIYLKDIKDDERGTLQEIECNPFFPQMNCTRNIGKQITKCDDDCNVMNRKCKPRVQLKRSAYDKYISTLDYSDDEDFEDYCGLTVNNTELCDRQFMRWLKTDEGKKKLLLV